MEKPQLKGLLNTCGLSGTGAVGVKRVVAQLEGLKHCPATSWTKRSRVVHQLADENNPEQHEKICIEMGLFQYVFALLQRGLQVPSSLHRTIQSILFSPEHQRAMNSISFPWWRTDRQTDRWTPMHDMYRLFFFRSHKTVDDDTFFHVLPDDKMADNTTFIFNTVHFKCNTCFTLNQRKTYFSLSTVKRVYMALT